MLLHWTLLCLCRIPRGQEQVHTSVAWAEWRWARALCALLSRSISVLCLETTFHYIRIREFLNCLSESGHRKTKTRILQDGVVMLFLSKHEKLWQACPHVLWFCQTPTLGRAFLPTGFLTLTLESNSVWPGPSQALWQAPRAAQAASPTFRGPGHLCRDRKSVV